MLGSADSHALARRELEPMTPVPGAEDRLPAALLERYPASALAQWRQVGLRLVWVTALTAPIFGTLWAVQALGGPFTLIVAALLLGLSAALFGWVVGRLRLAEGMEALARDRLGDALVAFDQLLASSERHRPQVIVHASLGRAEVLWRKGDPQAAAQALDEAEAYVRRADIPPIGAATRRLLLARKAQLAACSGSSLGLDRARAWLRELESLAPDPSHRAATEQWLRFVRTTQLAIDFHAHPDAAPQWHDSIVPAGDTLERALLTWAAERHGDCHAIAALQAELLAPDGRGERKLLRARAPRLAAWIESWQGVRGGYR